MDTIIDEDIQILTALLPNYRARKKLAIISKPHKIPSSLYEGKFMLLHHQATNQLEPAGYATLVSPFDPKNWYWISSSFQIQRWKVEFVHNPDNLCIFYIKVEPKR